MLKNYKIIAHKCGYYEPKLNENSLDALNYSIDKDYIDGIELDVQLTKDDKLVVIHDKKVNKLSNGKGLVRKLTFKQLKELDFHGNKIMTLEEALKIFPNNKQMLIEIKRPLIGMKKVIDKYYELIEKYKEKNIITICFISDVLSYLKQKDKNLKTGILVNKKQFYNLFNSKADYVFINKKILSKKVIKYILLKNKNLGIYTINSKKEFENIDNILNKEIPKQYNKQIFLTTIVPSLLQNK